MGLEWFWFLVSRNPIFPSCNGGWTGGPWKTLSLGPKSGSPVRGQSCPHPSDEETEADSHVAQAHGRCHLSAV